MKLAISVLLISLVSITLSAQPGEDEFVKEVLDNASHEIITCSSFYNIVAGALKRAGKQNEGVRLDTISSALLGYSRYLALQAGRSEEMASKVTLARMKIETERMTQEIDAHYSNISLLSSKYGKTCKKLFNQDPELLVEKWKQIITERHKKSND